MSSTLETGRLRIRMYRVGFGECFLVSLPEDNRHRHLLVDCGVHQRGNLNQMARVVADVRTESGDHLDAVIVTHAHQDHISGFGTEADAFAQVTVDEIWMPWTEDPSDSQALRLRAKQLALARQLRAHLKHLKRLTPSTDALLENAVGFSLASNAESMRVARGGFKGTQNVRYLEAGDRLTRASGIAALNVQVLGPSRDESALRRMDPPAGQRWLGGAASSGDYTVQPFARQEQSRKQFHASNRRRFGNAGTAVALTHQEERELQGAAVASDSLALKLDSVLNNTSLVLLLRYRGAVMLFPGDAQWGSWENWLTKQGADALLGEITFLKVGHHGSHNATPRTLLAKLSHPEISAMISTQDEPWDSIPKGNLVADLTRHCKRRVARSDSIKLGSGPYVAGPTRLPRAFKRGEFWIDYQKDL